MDKQTEQQPCLDFAHEHQHKLAPTTGTEFSLSEKNAPLQRKRCGLCFWQQ